MKTVEKGKMEQQDARATLGLQDALELLPVEMISKIVPATRTFVVRLTSKTMRTAVENANVRCEKRSVKFRNRERLLDKCNGLNAWYKVIVLRLTGCDFGDGTGRTAQAIAEALRVNNTVTKLDLGNNRVGVGGA